LLLELLDRVELEVLLVQADALHANRLFFLTWRLRAMPATEWMVENWPGAGLLPCWFHQHRKPELSVIAKPVNMDKSES
jgi:hypothetical protein